MSSDQAERMRPLSDLDCDLCRDLKGMVFDIDDTVTRDGRLELESYAALYSLAADGLRLIAVTGRPLGWADILARLWPVDMVVGENGAGWVWRDDGGLGRGYFDDEPTRAAQKQRLQGVAELVARDMPQVRLSDDQGLRRCDLAFDIGEAVQLPPPDIEALVGLIESTGLRSSVSSVHAHAVPGDWNKASGTVRAAREVLGLDVSDPSAPWLFIGDSGNDAAAFEFFRPSIGVANVREHISALPVPPEYVTVADRGRGFAEAAKYVLRARHG